MRSLLVALQSRFVSANLNATMGGLYLGVAPTGSTMPYATARPMVSPVTQTYGTTGGYSEPQVDFFVTGVDPDAALLLCESLRDGYKNQVLTISGGKMLNCLLVNDPIPGGEFPVKDAAGNDAFEWMTSFRFSVNG